MDTTAFIAITILFENDDRSSFNVSYKEPVTFEGLDEKSRESLLIAGQTVRNTIMSKLSADGELYVSADTVNSMLPDTMECSLIDFAFTVFDEDCQDVEVQAFPIMHEAIEQLETFEELLENEE